MFTSYQSRPVAFLGLESLAGYRLKVYSIQYGDRTFARERFADGWELAASALPQPGMTVDRPGAGFAILHAGRTCGYVILCWWDRENELPTRVFLSEGGHWRPAVGGESFCVWDLRVIWHEREAYVGTVLSSENAGGLEAYLACGFEGDA